MRSLRQRQRGVGLLDIMIALTIALFLLAGLFTLFLNTRQTFGDQNQLAQLQDRERFAMSVVANAIQQAGYWPSPQIELRNTALPADATFTVAGQFVSGSTGTAPASDTLALRTKTAPGDSTMDCLGGSNTGAAPLISTSTFSIDATNKQLACSVNGGAPVPLVAGVNSMTVLFGVDSNADDSADQYMTASAVTANNWWGNVKSVNVSLTFANPLAAQPGQPATLTLARTVKLMNPS